MNASPVALAASLVAATFALCGCGGHADAQVPTFTLSSPDLARNTFAMMHILNGFGCTGGNVSPAR